MRCHTTPDHLFHQLKGSDLWKPANQDCASRWCWLYFNWHCFDLSNWLCLLKVVEGSQEEIQNLPSLPEPEPQVRPAFFVPMKGKLLSKLLLQAESPRRSPKKESPILENRKPGRPRWESFFQPFLWKIFQILIKIRTRPDLPGLLRKPDNNGLTRLNWNLLPVLVSFQVQAKVCWVEGCWGVQMWCVQ